MAERFWYYLHTNGELICKRFEPEVEEGGFVRHIWTVDMEDRGTAHILLIEAAAMGAKKERIDELRKRWAITDEDCQEFAKRAGLKVFQMDGFWWAMFADFKNFQESQFGCAKDGPFQALVALCAGGPLGKEERKR